MVISPSSLLRNYEQDDHRNVKVNLIARLDQEKAPNTIATLDTGRAILQYAFKKPCVLTVPALPTTTNSAHNSVELFASGSDPSATA